MLCNQLTDAEKEILTMEVFVEELLKKIYSCFHEELKKGMKSKHTEIIFLIMQRDMSPLMGQFKAIMNPEKMDLAEDFGQKISNCFTNRLRIT